MTEADRIARFARWLKQYDRDNYARWTETRAGEPVVPSVDELVRLAHYHGVNDALSLIRRKFFEVFIDADVNWADVLDCDIASHGGREWHRSNPITEDAR